MYNNKRYYSYKLTHALCKDIVSFCNNELTIIIYIYWLFIYFFRVGFILQLINKILQIREQVTTYVGIVYGPKCLYLDHIEPTWPNIYKDLHYKAIHFNIILFYFTFVIELYLIFLASWYDKFIKRGKSTTLKLPLELRRA